MVSRFYEREGGLSLVFADGTRASFANALRRSLLNDVGAVGVDSVDIFANSSIFPCELLAHRVGLVPTLPCAAAGDVFELEARGPCDVFSDLCVQNGSGGGGRRPRPCLLPGVLLFTLKKGERVHMRGRFKRSSGKENARFQRTSGVSAHLDEHGKRCLSFESIDASSAVEHLLAAVDALLYKLERVVAASK